MALREFRMTEDAASRHEWTRRTRHLSECARCRALAEIRGGTYHQVYPPDPSVDCARPMSPEQDPRVCREGDLASGRASVQPIEPVRPRPSGRVERPELEAEVGVVRIRFGEGNDPVYVAAVLRALGNAT
jgi:hypothetical protein